MPDIVLSEGYSVSYDKNSRATFSVMCNNEIIGYVGWHGYYYPQFAYKGKGFGYGIANYVKTENAQQKCASMIVAMHKVTGSFNLNCLFRLVPNPMFLSYNLYTSYLFTNDMAHISTPLHVATLHKTINGWTLVQHYGEGNMKFETIQEALDKSVEIAMNKKKENS